ncbi:MAG: 6-phosphogluconolactonase [Bacteroidota bacterium]|nr:6-phosphogluconolactonase [Bacteroidota bacterium]
MNISISRDASELGRQAADLISETLNRLINENGEARIAVSTGSSQFGMFNELIQREINWSVVEIFHLDEYIGLPVTHKASFRKYLNERFISHITPKKFHSVTVEGDVKARIRDLSFEIGRKPIDIGLIGIGVNGHIAFNDPPADFNSRDAYIIVKLDDQCKMQQVNEGWFGSVGEVPGEAISMSVWQIMQCRKIISVVPHEVKAEAVFKTLTSRLNPDIPATMLKQHPDWNLFLDRNSASKLISF